MGFEIAIALGPLASLGRVLDTDRTLALAHRAMARPWVFEPGVESSRSALLRFSRALLDWYRLSSTYLVYFEAYRRLLRACWQLSVVVHDQPVAFQHRRISRVLIQIAQRWIVETGAVEQVGAGLGHHRDQTEMDKFGCLLANDVDADQSHVVLPKDQF